MNQFSQNRVKIFGVPLDLGTQKLGVDMGPSAIRHAGLHGALSYNKIEFVDYGDLYFRHTPNRHPKETIGEISEKLSSLVFEAIKEKYVPVILGGDHSVSIGSIAGASKSANSLGVLWFDFHADANTPESSPSGNIHGMPVAISLGYGYPELVNSAGFKPKVLPENIIIIGSHDIDPPEMKFLSKLGVRVYSLFDIDKFGIAKVLEASFDALKHCDLLHVSFDIDVLNPSIAPGTGILSKGGLSYREASYIMKTIGDHHNLSSIDIIEVNPLLDKKNMTAELAVELLLSCLGGSFGDYERNYILNQRHVNQLQD